jgi:ABC-2 type transport system permease protein
MPFTPTRWYTLSIDAVRQMTDFTWAGGLRDYAIDLGIVLLFAVAIFAVAMLVGHLRRQTADAGGQTLADDEE